jgi:dynein heavy chain 1
MLDEEPPNPAAIAAVGSPNDNMMIFDPRKMQDYLEQLLPLVLDAEISELQDTLFTYPDTMEKLKRFANDPQAPVVFIMKDKEGRKDEGRALL